MSEPEPRIRQLRLDEALLTDPLGEEPKGVSATGKVFFPSELPYETQLRQQQPRALADAGRIKSLRYGPPWNEEPGARWSDAPRRRKRPKRK